MLQTGLYSRYTKNMVLGLPSDIINGKIAQIKSAWRGAFLANGRLSDPGKASYLEIVCPNHEAALALVSTARRLGITAKPRKLRSSDASPCAIPTHRTYAHSYGCAALRTRVDRKAFRRRSSGQSQPSGQLRRRQHASQRQAAAEACDKVRQAFEILGDDIPDNLKSAGQLRLDHADASLEQLGRLADPPITKDAIAGRIRRLLQLAEKTKKARRQSA